MRCCYFHVEERNYSTQLGGGDLVKGKEVILEQHDCMLHWLFTLMNKYIMKIILKFRARAKFKLDIVYH